MSLICIAILANKYKWNFSVLNNKIEKEIEKMTPEEKIVFDKGVEEMKGEICGIHGDVCECSEDTKRKIWEDRKIPKITFAGRKVGA